MEYNGQCEGIIKEPQLEDVEIREMTETVWDGYRHMSDYKIIEFLHRRGMPWWFCYKPNENNVIPDECTKIFYADTIKRLAGDKSKVKS
jgi:uncharacterized phage-associated protein